MVFRFLLRRRQPLCTERDTAVVLLNPRQVTYITPFLSALWRKNVLCVPPTHWAFTLQYAYRLPYRRPVADTLVHSEGLPVVVVVIVGSAHFHPRADFARVVARAPSLYFSLRLIYAVGQICENPVERSLAAARTYKRRVEAQVRNNYFMVDR